MTTGQHWTARVLFLEGEGLVGAKQNRILNTSVLNHLNVLQVSLPVAIQCGLDSFKMV